MATKRKCPWPRPVVRDAVHKAIGRIGGDAVFAFVGPDVRRAIIRAACWDQVNTAVMVAGSTVSMDAESMSAIEREFMHVAGIAEENGW